MNSTSGIDVQSAFRKCFELRVSSFGKRRTITKFPKLLGKVLVKGVSKVQRHFSGDAEALERSGRIIASLSLTRAPEDIPPLIVSEIITPLFQDDNHWLQEQTAKAVAVVAAQVPAETCLALLNYPRALEGLVRLLFRKERANVQEGAAFALINLVGASEECQRKLAEYPNALSAVVCLLSQDRNAQVLMHGASLLFLLGLLPEYQVPIVEFPGALEGLVRLLLVEMPLLQGRAALAISALAASPDTKETIAEFPLAFMGILQLLEKDDLPEVQECAVGAVANLITALTAPRILEIPNVLERLVLLAPTCEAALVAIINLDYFGRKQSAKEMAEQALARCRRLPEFRLLNYPTSV
ncbi:hypothetical protein R1sor_008287 [Riccia sorocarpa]|uniref:Uncharacterized protein n=1 Tax=Riccia sorocarpa TaxID=122646 RepID=A0ABD3HUL5_9MARC